MKFDGNNWINEGLAGFSAGRVGFTSLAFSPAGQAYVGYADSANLAMATVMFYDAPTGINEPEHLQLSLYPNPASNELTIDLKNVHREIRCIEVDDVTGNQVFATQSSENKITLDVGNYAAGIYIIKVKMASSNYTGKFCKE
jgi:hypothetical protein